MELDFADRIPNIDLLSWVFGNSDYDDDKPIFVDAHDASKSISRRTALEHIKKLIAGLLAQGIRPGDSVCVHSFNNVYYTLVYLAIIGARGCFVGSNPAYTSYELNHLFDTTITKIIIVEPNFLKNVLPAAAQNGITDNKIFVFDTDGSSFPAEYKSWWTLQDYSSADWHVFDDEVESKSTMTALMSTSGTTGLPKAAAVSNYALIAHNIMCYDSKDKPYDVIRLLCLPQFHAFAGPLYHIAPLREGHTTYVMRRFSLANFVEYIKVFKITETAVANPIILSILASEKSVVQDISSLRYVWTAGAPLAAPIQNALGDLLHKDAIVSQVWGLTEIGWITTFLYPESDRTGSVGRLLPGIQAKVMGANDTELHGDDVRGEILVRGYSLMSGYLKNTEATKSALDNGWLRTGDIGYQHEGKWYIVDRAKELIKVRGWQVSPAELETCLLTHPYITDAAVIGVDFNDDRGELPRAYIVVSANAPDTITDQAILDFMGQRLAKYKTLAGGVKRVSTITRNASGKILKNLLRDSSKQEIDTKHGDSITDKTDTKCAETVEGETEEHLEIKVKPIVKGKEKLKGNNGGDGTNELESKHASEEKEEKPSMTNENGTELDDGALAALLKFINPAACFR